MLKLFSLKNSTGRSATVFCDKTVAHCNYSLPCFGKLQWTVSYSNTNFGRASAKIYTCFERRKASVMQNFQNLGASGGGVTNFDETPKRHILG